MVVSKTCILLEVSRSLDAQSEQNMSIDIIVDKGRDKGATPLLPQTNFHVVRRNLNRIQPEFMFVRLGQPAA
jgi:hypothetical protein